MEVFGVSLVKLLILTAIKTIVIVFMFAFGLGGLLSWVERKQSALIQDRIGPNRASIFGIRLFGLFHVIADGIKIFLKEDFVPERANKFLFRIAPILALTPSLLVFVLIPFSPDDSLNISSNIATSILILFAISSISVYGAAIGGWSSGNKFSLLGGLRASAQMFSYEVALTLALIGIFMVYGTLSFNEIVMQQGGTFLGFLPKWGIFTQPLAFIIFVIAAQVENKRAPFDVTEADSELVSGFFTEYSGFNFAGFYLGEFVQIVVIATLISVFFLGGWQIPYVDVNAYAGNVPVWLNLLCIGAFLTKIVVSIWFLMMVRWTLPRFRYDQIMEIGWKYLIPLTLINIFITGSVMFITRG